MVHAPSYVQAGAFSYGLWQEFGATSLAFLEYLLIGVANAAFSGELLNTEGTNRCRLYV